MPGIAGAFAVFLDYLHNRVSVVRVFDGFKCRQALGKDLKFVKITFSLDRIYCFSYGCCFLVECSDSLHGFCCITLFVLLKTAKAAPTF